MAVVLFLCLSLISCLCFIERRDDAEDVEKKERERIDAVNEERKQQWELAHPPPPPPAEGEEPPAEPAAPVQPDYVQDRLEDTEAYSTFCF